MNCSPQNSNSRNGFAEDNKSNFTRKHFLISVALSAIIFVFTAPAQPVPSLTDSQRLSIAFEALSRLQRTALKKDQELTTAVESFLAKSRGTDHFLQVVKQFQLTNQNAGLLEIAAKDPGGESGVEAMRLILASQDFELLESALQQEAALRIVEALGNIGQKETIRLLLPIVLDETRDLSLRKQAVQSLARTEEGAQELLNLAKEEKLARALKLTASAELHKVRWEKVKQAAVQVFPLPQGRDAQPLPSVTELLQIKGDVANGGQVFFRTETACSSCHQIYGRGTEVGPALSEIGDKLGKEALFESILEPSAGISFGYEAHEVELKSGDEFYGLIVSETDDELMMKDLNGIVVRHKKSQVIRRQQMKMSIMPTGLEQTMTAQEFVDLVEFLSALRKAE